MRGMDAGPGTDLGSVGWYLGIWVTMMAAMMLPSATPMVLLFSKVAASSTRSARPRDGAVRGGIPDRWTAYGLVAYGLFRLVRELDPSFLAWDREGPVVAGAAIVLAGVYQLTPFKRVVPAPLPHAAQLRHAPLAQRRLRSACGWGSCTERGASAAAGR